MGSTIARHYVEEITCEVYKLSLKPKVVGSLRNSDLASKTCQLDR